MTELFIAVFLVFVGLFLYMRNEKRRPTRFEIDCDLHALEVRLSDLEIWMQVYKDEKFELLAATRERNLKKSSPVVEEKNGFER